MTHSASERGTRPGAWMAEVALLLMAIMWGVNFSVMKFGTTVMPALAYNGVRITIAAAALAMIALIWGGPAPTRRDVFALIALGVLGNGIYQILFIQGLARTRAGEAALVIGASPALMALFAWMRGIERISRRAMLGIALSIFGVGLVVLGRAAAGENGGGGSLLGDLLVLCGSVCWAMYTILLMPYTRRVSGWWLITFTIVGGCLVLVAAGASEIAAVNWSTVTGRAWAAILYSGLGGLVIAYMFWFYGVRSVGPTRTALYGNLQPLIALLVAWMTLGEMPTLWQVAGAGTIVSGVLLTRAQTSEAV